MKQYIRERQHREKTSRLIGIALAVAVPAFSAVFCSFSGIKYLYPPPQETSFLIDFEDEPEVVEQNYMGSAPRAEEVDLTNPIELVQKSESPYEVSDQNLTPETRQDDFGDVETPAVPQEKEPELDPRASFPGMAKKDTSLTSPHSAREASGTFKAGQSKGNTDSGKTDGTPNAHLKGRNVVGALPRPSYSAQLSGIVVVTIWVDQYGTVQKAQAGADGTTVTDKTLWAAARKAAMDSHFNMSADAPALQQGTITYIFNLK